MNSDRQLRLGVLADGVGATTWGWRQPGVKPDASTDIEHYKALVRRAEAAKFDFLFVSDSLYITPQSAPHYLNRLEPLTMMSALAGATSHIGLAGTISTSFEQPFTVARQLASLDHISSGRAGWNVVTTGLEGAALNYSLASHLGHADRYRRAEEHVAVTRALWDSWEDDAFSSGQARGQFFDPDRLHTLDHHGEFFRSKAR